jgi:hypothetical protein
MGAVNTLVSMTGEETTTLEGELDLIGLGLYLPL